MIHAAAMAGPVPCCGVFIRFESAGSPHLRTPRPFPSSGLRGGEQPLARYLAAAARLRADAAVLHTHPAACRAHSSPQARLAAAHARISPCSTAGSAFVSRERTRPVGSQISAQSRFRRMHGTRCSRSPCSPRHASAHVVQHCARARSTPECTRRARSFRLRSRGGGWRASAGRDSSSPPAESWRPRGSGRLFAPAANPQGGGRRRRTLAKILCGTKVSRSPLSCATVRSRGSDRWRS